MIRLLFAVSLFVEATAFYTYNSILFSSSQSRIKRILTYLATYIIVFLLHNLSSYYSIVINITVFLAANLFLLLYVYRLRFISALVHALLISGFSIISEIFVGFAFQHFSRTIWEDLNNINNLMLLFPSVIVFFLLTLSAAIIEKRTNEKGGKTAEIALFIVLSGISFISTVFNFIGIIISSESKTKDFFLTTNIIIFLVLLCGFLIMHNYMKIQGNISGRQKQLTQAEKDAADFMGEIKERDLEQRILIHDIRKHLSAIQIMSKSGDLDGIDNYIKSLTDSPALAPPIRYCANDYLNSIIFKYLKEAEKIGIKMSVDSNSVDFSFVKDRDLTTIMCNLLDNAFDAVKSIKNGHIAVTLTQDVDKHISMIFIVNSCAENVKFSQDIPVSNKPETLSHGLGIKSVLKAIEKYDGDINMYQDENKDFHTIVLLNERDAI